MLNVIRPQTHTTEFQPLLSRRGMAFAALCTLAALYCAASVADESAGAAAARGPVSYTQAVIVSPANDSAVRSNSGTLVIQGRVSPELESGHQAQLLLDGVPQGAPNRSLEFFLENIDRGTHRLEIQIIDPGGKVVFAGAPSKVHLLRHSRLHP